MLLVHSGETRSGPLLSTKQSGELPATEQTENGKLMVCDMELFFSSCTRYTKASDKRKEGNVTHESAQTTHHVSCLLMLNHVIHVTLGKSSARPYFCLDGKMHIAIPLPFMVIITRSKFTGQKLSNDLISSISSRLDSIGAPNLLGATISSLLWSSHDCSCRYSVDSLDDLLTFP